MDKLKNKVFYTLLTILTIFLLCFFVIYNVRNYVEQYKSVENSLKVATNNINEDDKIPPDKHDDIKKEPLDENIKFIDSTIYTVLLNKDDNIKDVINRSNNEISDSEIISLAELLLKDENIKPKYIGCLYFTDYSYVYIRGNSLTLTDNSIVKEKLIESFVLSFFICTLFEIINVIIVKKITNWIIKPVNDSFTKQKEFVADASHELKTPLSVIMASSEALAESPNETKWLKNIQTECERMNSLISDLLDLSFSEKKNTNQFKIGNLSKVVELSILTFEGRTYEKNIDLDYEIENNIQLLMDENSIKQLVEILLDNAINHSEEKGTINVSLRSAGNNIELLVKNTGDEIPKEDEEKIFERFYRIDKSRNRNENRYGLGLAIAKNITENHNGKINAFSCDGITTFKVVLKK